MEDTNTAAAEAVSEMASGIAATPSFWQSYGSTLIWVGIIGAAFAFLWYKGHLARFANYVRLTREELRKCSWPTWAELKGSTVIIAISILLLGIFTAVVDYVCTQVLLRLT